jgi:hypothetical protein
MQVPAAAPTSTLPTRPDSLTNSTKPVVLVRDTNCWCPFCERVSVASRGTLWVLSDICRLASHSLAAATAHSPPGASHFAVICCPPAAICPLVPQFQQVWLALEEKGIPYDCVLIELYNKPAWYKELVPTSLVPAVVSALGVCAAWCVCWDLGDGFQGPQASPQRGV